MEIIISDRRMFLFANQLTPQAAEFKAWEKKIVAFDAISKFGSFLTHPKDNDFGLIFVASLKHSIASLNFLSL